MPENSVQLGELRVIGLGRIVGIASDASANGGNGQRRIERSVMRSKRMEEFIPCAFRYSLYRRRASRKSSGRQRFSCFPRALVGVGIKRDARRILATRRGEQAFAGKQ